MRSVHRSPSDPLASWSCAAVFRLFGSGRFGRADAATERDSRDVVPGGLDRRENGPAEHWAWRVSIESISKLKGDLDQTAATFTFLGACIRNSLQLGVIRD